MRLDHCGYHKTHSYPQTTTTKSKVKVLLDIPFANTQIYGTQSMTLQSMILNLPFLVFFSGTAPPDLKLACWISHIKATEL